MSHFIPNETKIFVPHEPPWIKKPLKTMLNRKIDFSMTTKNGYKAENKVRLETSRIECQQAVETSELSYLMNLGNNVTIENDEIISLIRKINPNKATGPDGISGQMLLLCDESDIHLFK